MSFSYHKKKIYENRIFLAVLWAHAIHDEDNRSSYFLSIAVFLTVLSATAGMPLDKKMDIWSNPCGTHVRHRHSRSSGMDSNQTKQQMKMFNSRIDRLYNRDLTELYPNYPKNGSTNTNCLNVKAFLKHLNKFKKPYEKIWVFYKMTANIGKFIDKLMDIPVTTSMKFNVSKRNKIYDDTRQQLKSLLCEFNTTLADYRESHPGVKEPKEAKVPKLNNKCLVKSLDSSRAQMLDVDFFKKFRIFFRRSRKVLRMKGAKATRGKKPKGGKKNKNNSKNRRKTKLSDSVL